MHWLSAALPSAALLAALAAGAGPKRPPKPASDHVDLQNFQPRPDLPAASGVRKATKLVYVMGSAQIWGNGAEATIDALATQQALKPTGYSLAYVGGVEDIDPVYYFGDDPARTTRKSPLAPGMKQLPSNSLQLMSKVLAWAYSTYPAEARYLEIESHGNGVLGIGTDENSPYGKDHTGLLPIQGLARALRDGSPGRPIDVVFFNACKMGNLESLYEIAPWVRYVVASEYLVYPDSTVTQAQPLLFETLMRDGLAPAQVARELARLATHQFVRHSQVAIDTARLQPLVDAVAKLAAAVLKAPSSDHAALADILRQTADLWVVARNLEARAKDPQVKAAAHALFRLQAGATLYERSSKGVAAFTGDGDGFHPAPPGPGPALDLRNAGGLSIYAGGSGDKFLSRGYAQTRFARATGWDKVLRALGRP
jgi:hypothetical protein